MVPTTPTGAPLAIGDRRPVAIDIMGAVQFDGVIVGGGVVGLAAARALASRGHDVLVVERHARLGTETSSRNSGVVHAGLYYPPDSLKARACVRGRELLYEFARAHGVDHSKTGKLVVATDAEEDGALEALATRARANGVDDLTWRSPSWLAQNEPNLRAVRALDVGVSGIVDVHGLVGALARSASDAGATLATGVTLGSLEARPRGWRCHAGSDRVDARFVVNAAGFGADRLAEFAGVDIDSARWRLHPWKGSYFALSAAAPRPARALVYPLPMVGGLGVHLTRDLGGQVLAGPDAAPARDLADLAVDEARAPAFAASVQRYLPGLRAEHLRPAYAGLRPKRCADGAFADFVLEEAPAGLFHLLAIESPGITAALALAETLALLVEGRSDPHAGD